MQGTWPLLGKNRLEVEGDVAVALAEVVAESSVTHSFDEG